MDFREGKTKPRLVSLKKREEHSPPRLPPEASSLWKAAARGPALGSNGGIHSRGPSPTLGPCKLLGLPRGAPAKGQEQCDTSPERRGGGSPRNLQHVTGADIQVTLGHTCWENPSLNR